RSYHTAIVYSVLFSHLHTLSYSIFFFFNNPPTTEISTLSLHDALPILHAASPASLCHRRHWTPGYAHRGQARADVGDERRQDVRSEEHTSELQSPYDLVCRLLLEKKKKKKNEYNNNINKQNRVIQVQHT